jgi:hypothetical protein
VTRWKEGVEWKERWLSRTEAFFQNARSDLLTKIEEKKTKIDQFKKLSAEIMSTTTDQQLKKLTDLTPVEKADDYLYNLFQSTCKLSTPVSDSTLDFLRNLKTASLLPALDLTAKANLDSFLSKSDQSLVSY